MKAIIRNFKFNGKKYNADQMRCLLECQEKHIPTCPIECNQISAGCMGYYMHHYELADVDKCILSNRDHLITLDKIHKSKHFRKCLSDVGETIASGAFFVSICTIPGLILKD